jgi:hypothetical protein
MRAWRAAPQARRPLLPHRSYPGARPSSKRRHSSVDRNSEPNRLAGELFEAVPHAPSAPNEGTPKRLKKPSAVDDPAKSNEEIPNFRWELCPKSGLLTVKLSGRPRELRALQVEITLEAHEAPH